MSATSTVAPPRGRTPGVALVVALLVLVELALLLFLLPIEWRAQEREAKPSLLLVTDGGAPSQDGVPTARDALRRLDARGLVVAHPGAGFASGAVPLSQSVLQDLPAAGVDIVVINGGEADIGQPAERVERFADRMLAALRERLGEDGQVVLIGPVPSESTLDDPRLRDVNAALRSAAERNDVRFVDAVEMGWRQGSPLLPVTIAKTLEPVVEAAHPRSMPR